MKARRVEKYYQDLLSSNAKSVNGEMEFKESKKEPNADSVYIPEKWKGQIEKVFLSLSLDRFFRVCRVTKKLYAI